MWETPKNPSKMPEAVRKYQRECFATISANVPRPFKAEFRRACQDAGTTMHAVLLRAAAEYVAAAKARE